VRTESSSERILVGITTRNRAALLPRAIASALAQQGVKLSVAVHDDASTDETPALAASFPSVEWTRSETNIGLRESRNRWMRRDDADYFVSLDDDAWFLGGDEIALALERFRAEPALAAVAFDILSPDRPAPAQRRSPQSTSMFVGCGHVLRLSAARAAGCYASSPGPYGSEEKDLCLRLADLGFRLEFLSGVHVWHEKAWADRDNRPLHRSGVCNELIMTLRRCPLPDCLVVLPLKIASYLRFWLGHREYARAGVAGVGDFLRHVPAAWRTRQPVRRSTFWRFHRTEAPTR
jgi:GT2 family glycosyltransferase